MTTPKPLENIHFLVIDDDGLIRDVVAAWLLLAGAAGVRRANSVAVAAKILSDPQLVTDCIICDYGMEAASGLQFLKNLRSGQYAKIRPDMFFVMLTASGDSVVVRAAIDLDVNGYVMKPITQDSLLKSLQKCFTRRLPLRSLEYYAGCQLPERA
jgi:DNA-binding NarL/FixJ family response regulator